MHMYTHGQITAGVMHCAANIDIHKQVIVVIKVKIKDI